MLSGSLLEILVAVMMQRKNLCVLVVIAKHVTLPAYSVFLFYFEISQRRPFNNNNNIFIYPRFAINIYKVLN